MTSESWVWWHGDRCIPVSLRPAKVTNRDLVSKSQNSNQTKTDGCRGPMNRWSQCRSSLYLPRDNGQLWAVTQWRLEKLGCFIVVHWSHSNYKISFICLASAFCHSKVWLILCLQSSTNLSPLLEINKRNVTVLFFSFLVINVTITNNTNGKVSVNFRL